MKSMFIHSHKKRKVFDYGLFHENHCGPAVLKVPAYSTELVAISFFKKVGVKCTKALTDIQIFHGEPA